LTFGDFSLYTSHKKWEIVAELFSMNNTKRKFDLKTAIILLYAPIALTIFRYYGSSSFYNLHFGDSGSANPQYYYFSASLLLLGIIPLAITVFGFRMKLSDLGLALGDKRLTLLVTLFAIPVMILIAYLSSKNPAFRAEYPLNRNLLTSNMGVSSYVLIYGVYYIGWELFFRGFMLFGLKDSLGEINSILIQTIPSCLMHIGKPDAEIFSSIFAGLVFGWVVLKCRSIWPVFFGHWALGACLDLFIING
jgi:membrane protease YdiL (CAAX protease family)